MWYNPNGVANILSLSNVASNYHVTMDTKRSKSITVHTSNSSVIDFTPSRNGLYKHKLENNEYIQHMWSMLSTVRDRTMGYSKRACKRALMARKLQNIIMQPGMRMYQDVAIEHLHNCPVTKANIKAANDIFGKNLGSLKGKTAQQSAGRVSAGVDALPPDVLPTGRNMNAAIDIMFVNKIPFFIKLLRDLRFGTVESIPNRQVTTVRNCLEKVVRFYKNRGLTVTSVLADSKFELLRPWFLMLNTAAADEHVPMIERYIHTVKERTRRTYTMLSYCHLPQIMLIHLVKNTVFWLNAFPTDDSVSKKYSP
jgi:hypothetical protein